MSWRIRQATYADLEDAALAKAWSWNDSLRGLVPDDVIEAQLHQDRIERTVDHWRTALENGGYLWIVVGDDGEVVGVAYACVGRDPDAPTPLELEVIYLREAAQGSGVADALLRTAIGDAPAHLWVLSANQRARSFYRRHGFSPDGAVRLVPGVGTKECWVRS